MSTRPVLHLLGLLLLFSCHSATSRGWRAVGSNGADATLEEMADTLAQADVVFLGEEHDNTTGHELQLRMIELLLERRGKLAISMEMFERDAQDQVSLYVAGAISEARFLGHSRPWGNYADYRPIVELARRENLPVIAANCFRPLASRVAKEGLGAVQGDTWAALSVDAGPGAYRDKFMALMGDHAGDMGSTGTRFFAAQCIKDDTMAESIAHYLSTAGDDAPLVVHLCGKFHSDGGLGTVERLLARRPDLDVAIVTMVSSKPIRRKLEADELAAADFVWVVPQMPEKPQP